MASPTLDVTDLERLKSLGVIDQNTTLNDDMLTSLIAQVGRVFESWLGPLKSESRTEDYDIAAFQKAIWTRAYPLNSITSIHNRSNFGVDWSDADEIESNWYEFNAYGRIEMDARLTPGMKALRVVYTGGWAADTGTLLSEYPDIVGAAERQILHSFRRRKDPDKSSLSEGGLTHTVGALRLLPSVQEVLVAHARTTF